ncbi:translation initiation factor IF-2-like [Vidua chalybeata]|uniref:translation initiation factor IF-2-like n=1 Tax=Vidua chalybeata TaxID=81927 RepID=UPI0023A7D900|nr:translation initiation factor IF-2-like [Vidua chalybeata]
MAVPVGGRNPPLPLPARPRLGEVRDRPQRAPPPPVPAPGRSAPGGARGQRARGGGGGPGGADYRRLPWLPATCRRAPARPGRGGSPGPASLPAAADVTPRRRSGLPGRSPSPPAAPPPSRAGRGPSVPGAAAENKGAGARRCQRHGRPLGSAARPVAHPGQRCLKWLSPPGAGHGRRPRPAEAPPGTDPRVLEVAGVGGMEQGQRRCRGSEAQESGPRAEGPGDDF